MTVKAQEVAKSPTQPYPEGTILLNVSQRNLAHNFWALLYSQRHDDLSRGWYVLVHHGLLEPENGPAQECLMYSRTRPGIPWETQIITIPPVVLDFDRGMANRLIASLTAKTWEL